MDVREVVRRFIMSSFEHGGRVIIAAPAKYLLFKRFVFWPYTNGEAPWSILCDLARFAEQVDLVTSWPNTPEELKVIFNIAHCIKPPTSLPLRLYLATQITQMLLINEKEAMVDGCLVAKTEELVEVAEKIIAASRRVGIFEYDEIRREYCRHFRYRDARCY
jgi:hypothetical protein